MCEMFGGYCFESIMSDDTYYKKCPAECLADCQETAYTVLPSSVPIDLESVCKKGGFYYQYFEQNFNKHFAFYSYKVLVEGGGSIPDLMTSFTNGSMCKDYVKDYIVFVSVQSPSTNIIHTHENIAKLFLIVIVF